MHFKTTLIAIALPTSIALAGVTLTYDDRAAFELDAGIVQTETFEGETLGQFAMPTTFGSGLAADLTSGAVSSLIEAGDPDSYGFQNTTDGGRKYLRMGHIPIGAGPETGSYTLAFTTQQATNAFGFDISGFQPNSAADGFNITFLNNGQVVDELFVPSDQAFDDVGFYGFFHKSAMYNEIRVNIPVLNQGGIADFAAFDDVTWGVVPAPSTAALFALAGFTASRRRR